MTLRKQRVIEPEQWDFRSLSEDELYAACEYEYNRELVSPAQAREARRLLNEFDKIEHKEFPYAYPSMDGVPFPLMYFAQKFPAFPRAWLKLPDRTRAKYVKKSGKRIKSELWDGFSLLNDPAFWDPEDPPERMLQLIESGRLSADSYGIYGYYAARINWAQPDKQIIKDFSSWLQSTRPKEVKPVIVKGKKAVPNDNSRLKWLGAYRLDASGMNFKAARNHITRHIGPKRNDPHDIIPDFQTPSSLQTAIKKANELLVQIASRSI